MLRALPNILTLARIIAVPVTIALLYWPGSHGRLAALTIFIAAGVTDFFDGWLARRLKAQSRFGAMLDPIADKLLVAGLLIALMAQGTVLGLDALAAYLILGREIFVSGLREFLAAEGRNLPVSTLAKWKTAAQMTAIGALLAFVGADAGFAAARFLLWAAALLSLWTGADYTIRAVGPLRMESH